jgi:hypothetical protein
MTRTLSHSQKQTLKEVLGSELARILAVLTEFFQGYPEPKKKRHTLGQHLDYAMTASFQILSNASFIYHSTILATSSIIKYLTKNV